MAEDEMNDEIARLRRGLRDEEASGAVKSRLLERLCTVLKGPNHPGVLLSWHDLPEVAQTLKDAHQWTLEENTRLTLGLRMVKAQAEEIKRLTDETQTALVAAGRARDEARAALASAAQDAESTLETLARMVARLAKDPTDKAIAEGVLMDCEKRRQEAAQA